MGDFHELTAQLIEEGIGFGSAFDGSRFGSVGSDGHQIAGEGQEQACPELAAHLATARSADGVVKLAQGVEAALNTLILRSHLFVEQRV